MVVLSGVHVRASVPLSSSSSGSFSKEPLNSEECIATLAEVIIKYFIGT